jgi:hypothetical protein
LTENVIDGDVDRAIKRLERRLKRDGQFIALLRVPANLRRASDGEPNTLATFGSFRQGKRIY